MHRKFMRLSSIAVWLCCGFTLCAETPRRDSDGIDFNRDIRPILSENCFHCHGMDPNTRKGKLRLDTPEGAFHGAITRGKAEESELIRRILSNDPDSVMPPPDSHRQLSAEQKRLLAKWINEGAEYDRHWAFKPPVKTALPKVKRESWPRNEIDHFILAKIEAADLKPSKPAALPTLLKRVSMDLTGLPPTLNQMEHWLLQKDPFATAVEELLASPHFGERMASDWMDAARYADTHGFNNDSLRTMWRWRDWVIEAFNSNKPYDEFIREQLAGDLLPNATLDQRIATGFNRNHVINSEGGIIDEEYRVEYVADRVRTFSTAWLGLTTECARCHDHKFDPITQKEFFQLFAFFNNVDEHGEAGRMANAAPFLLTPTREQQETMAQHRATMEAAETALQQLLQTGVTSSQPAEPKTSHIASTPLSTNVLVRLDLQQGTGEGSAFTNLPGGQFKLSGNVTIEEGPFIKKAMLFNGKGHLTGEKLPKGDDKWSFTTWVLRDLPQEGVLLSTMNYGDPPSSADYGRGVQIKLTASGAIELRLCRRWPAYSINFVTTEKIPVGEWRHLAVHCDGSNKAAGVRVLLDGEECFRTVLQDDFALSGLSGNILLGASGEKGSPSFAGALADLAIEIKPPEFDRFVGQVRADLEALASVSAAGSNLLPRVEARLRDPVFAKIENEWRAARDALLKLEREAPTTMVMRELPSARTTAVLFRGQYDQPRETVQPDVPAFLPPFPAGVERNRLGLAAWLTDPKQPLTSRVVVNRFWQSIFGTGLVKSAEDFGVQGNWPSHPELLDWLAKDFQENGWDVKRLLRQMVTSATYQQESRSTPELNERDPENRLLARAPRLRLNAELLRDQALQYSGLLRPEVGGSPVYPYQPANLYQGIVVAAPYPGTSYTQGSGKDLYRRSLYTFWKRTVPHPTLSTFDAPDREVCVARRLRTNTPLQAFASMNDTIQVEAARKLAERMLLEAPLEPSRKIEFAYQLVTARRPGSFEQKELARLLKQRLEFYRNNPDAAKALLAVGESKAADFVDASELAAYANVASLILNLDEALTRN